MQFDVDGDKSLVIADKNFIEIAERNMQGIVPLYYNMRKASPMVLTNQAIYDGLNAAFIGGNIGIYSNDISKIWNSEVFISGTDEEKQEALDMIKILCMENNFVIDYAKTLYKPERPKEVHKRIRHFVDGAVPHFFLYAKDKEINQVSVNNNSFVNKLEKLIINPRINCRKLGLKPIDYKLMMHNPNIQVKAKFLKNGRIDEKNTEPLIVKYIELSQNHYQKLDYDMADNEKQNALYNQIIKEVKNELSQFGYNESEIVDKLVYFLYYLKPNKHKSLLWNCYGNIIYNTLSKHIKPKTKSIQCSDCGEWFDVAINDNKSCRCKDCRNERNKILKKQRNKRYYSKRKD